MTTPRLSWVESANTGLTDFPLQNLPYGVFSTAERSTRAGVAIGDRIVDLRELAAAGLLPQAMREVFAARDVAVYFVYPSRRHIPRAVTAFTDFATAVMLERGMIEPQFSAKPSVG